MIWVWVISCRRSGGRCATASAALRPARAWYWSRRKPSPHATASPVRAAACGVNSRAAVQGGTDPQHRRERPVRVHRHHPAGPPRDPAAHPRQVPGLLQPQRHVPRRGAGQEPQPRPHRQRAGLVGDLPQQHVPLHRCRGARPGRSRPRCRTAGRCSGPASARPAARRPARCPADAAAAAACPSGHRAPAGTGHPPPARCRSAPHPADPGTRGRPGARPAAHAWRALPGSGLPAAQEPGQTASLHAMRQAGARREPINGARSRWAGTQGIM